MKRRRHVLMVPAWYPSTSYPHFGNFIHDQARALQAFAPDFALSVWNWKPAWRRASFTRPRELLRACRRWLNRPTPAWVTDADGLRVYVRPVFEAPRPFPTETRFLAGALREVIGSATAAHGDVDLVHAQVASNAGWACAAVCPEFRIPWILTEHMGPAMLADLAPHGMLDPRVAAVYTSCRALVAVSAAHAALLHRYSGREATVIPNVFDEGFFTPGPPPCAAAAFLVVAALRPVKAIDVLLRAYARAGAATPIPPLRIGGDGPLQSALKRLAASLGLGERVRFLGTLDREQVRAEMRRCAALVLPSRSESFGVVAIEAMGCGRPVLATACGGPQDIVTPETGILCSPDDEAALAAGLTEMARRWAGFDPTAVRRRAEVHFGRAAFAAKLGRMYDAVLQNPTAGLPH
jgi:glycosyltransferase involved in cell wall biosynthesis